MTAGRMLPRAALTGMLLAASAALAPVLLSTPVAAQQSEVRAVVNREAVTSYQMQQRAAWLRIRRADASNQAVLNELIDDALKRQEIRRLGITIPDEAIDAFVNDFAAQNNMTLGQLGQAFGQVGFSVDGFREFMRTNMGWHQAVRARVRDREVLSEQDVVQRMLQQGGEKPSTTEYTLQQVIFVVPQAERGAAMGRRMQEANALRQRFTTCPQTYQFAQGLRDVTVQEVGRRLQPELPTEWRQEISAINGRGTTRPKETQNGVEFIAVCDQRSVSDDHAATVVLQEREFQALLEGEPDVAFLTELRDRATIIRR